MQIEPKNIKNVLVIRNDRFGEFLLNIPALRALKETFKNAKIILVINPYVKALAECLSFVDEVIEWRQGKHPLSEKIGLLKLIRAKKIDIAVMLNPSKEFNILTFLAGIPIRAGYAHKWSFLLTQRLEDKKYLGEKHEVTYNLELVNIIGANTEDKTLFIPIDDIAADKLSADFNIKDDDNLIALHPWTSDPIKQWPKENFNRLAKRLIEELNMKVIVIGGKEELNESAKLFKNFGDNLINITGRTDLKQLALLLKKCRLLISGDSGPAHLASCVDTPVIAIFRNDIPGKNANRWGPWGNGHIIMQKNNLADISVEEVFTRVERFS